MIKRVPWLTVLVALQGFFFGCVDFIKNNDVLYTAMFAAGVEPVVPATYWAYGGWKAGITNAVVFLAGPFTCTLLIILYFLVRPWRVRDWKLLLAIAVASICLFSGMWDLTFTILVLRYWPGQLIGDEVAWLPLALSPEGEVIGISFSWQTGYYFILFRLMVGFLLPVMETMRPPSVRHIQVRHVKKRVRR